MSEVYGPAAAAENAVRLYREWLDGSPDSLTRMYLGGQGERRVRRLRAALPNLRGRNLACWCPVDAPCHADVLLRLANGPLCEAIALSSTDSTSEARHG